MNSFSFFISGLGGFLPSFLKYIFLVVSVLRRCCSTASHLHRFQGEICCRPRICSSAHNVSFLLWLLLGVFFITGFEQFDYDVPCTNVFIFLTLGTHGAFWIYGWTVFLKLDKYLAFSNIFFCQHHSIRDTN